MIAHRVTSVAVVLTAAWLTAGCQSSPVRPSAVITQAPPPAPAVTFLNITGIVSEAAAEPDAAAMPLSGASISVAVDPDFPLSTETDENGWYSLSQQAGTVTVTVSKEGYETQVISVDLLEDTVLNVDLKRSALEALRRKAVRR